MSGINQNGTNSLFPNVVPLPVTQNQKPAAQTAQEAGSQKAQKQGATPNADAPASQQAANALMSMVQGSLKVNVPKFVPSTSSLSNRTLSVLANADFDTMARDLADDFLNEEGLLLSGPDRSRLLEATAQKILGFDNLA